MAAMNQTDIVFPVVGMNLRPIRPYLYVTRTLHDFTIANYAGLKDFSKGQDGHLHCDSSGNCFTAVDYRIIHGIGPLLGWNIFLNRTVRVECELIHTDRQLTVDELRETILIALATSFDRLLDEEADEIRQELVHAKTHGGLINVLRSNGY
jgi:hypothetical protein